MSEATPEILVEQFDHVPQLHELIKNGGRPGLEYAQVCTHHLLKAQTDVHPEKGGWLMVNRPGYLILGPKGEAEMVLMTRGEEITAPSATAGARKCVVDTDVETLTGLQISKKDPANGKERVETKGPAPKIQDQKASGVPAQ